MANFKKRKTGQTKCEGGCGTIGTLRRVGAQDDSATLENTGTVSHKAALTLTMFITVRPGRSFLVASGRKYHTFRSVKRYTFSPCSHCNLQLIIAKG